MTRGVNRSTSFMPRPPPFINNLTPNFCSHLCTQNSQKYALYWFIYIGIFLQTFLTNVLKWSFFNLHMCLTFMEKNIENISLNSFVRWQLSSSMRRFGLQLEMCVRAVIDNFWSNLWSERMSFAVFFFRSKYRVLKGLLVSIFFSW